jgi:uncharacterized CHY-type Zn-finger protein
MPKKLTYKFVRDSFAKEGYTLLSKEYKNTHTKLDYICPKGHKHSTSFNNWRSGSRCRFCVINRYKTKMSDVVASFMSEGYTLISETYINAHTKLDYICPKGHRHSVTFNKWKNGRRCPYCSKHIAPTINRVKESFESEGYTLLSKDYTNSETKLDYICPNGHKHSVTWNNWSLKRRCPYCSGRFVPTIEYVRGLFEKEGYTLLSTVYVNSQKKLNYICPNGNKHSIKYGHWRQGHRCPCYRCQKERHLAHSISQSGPNHPNWRGGISFEPYCQEWRDVEYKSSIKKRDGNRCLNPYCDSKNPNDLTIHHIDYNKKNCRPSNLITVCRSCNAKANKNREWHTAWYQVILQNRYNYKY